MRSRQDNSKIKSLRNKLLAVLSVCLILVIVLVMLNNVYMYISAENSKKQLLVETDSQIIDIYSKQLMSLRMIAEGISTSFTLTEYVQNDYCLNNQNDDNPDFERNYEDLLLYLEMPSQINEYVKSVSIYDYELGFYADSYTKQAGIVDRMQLSWIFNKNFELRPLKQEEPISIWAETQEDIKITYRADFSNSQLGRPVFLTLSIDKQVFGVFLSQMKITENAQNVLIVPKYNMIYTVENDTASKDFASFIADNIERLSTEGRLTVEHDYSWYYILYRPLDVDQDLALVYIIPDNDIDYNAHRSNLFLTLALSLVLLAIIFFVFRKLLTDNIQKPISQLITGMERVGSGDFTHSLEEPESADAEIKSLFSAYNSMTDRATTLIEDLYQAELYRKQLELQSLQEKINPHFLYNTLDTINWTAKEHNVDEISRIVIALSTMYRKVFNKGRDLITLQDSLEGITCYLDIQRIRYGESFYYEIDCPEELQECYILNLILQTIVENAIIHGLQEHTAGWLKITARKQDEDVIIVVQDNGIGMTEEKLKLITASINSEKLESESGLRNVQKRMKLYYGKQYGISIESKFKEGTSVTMRVPYRKMEKND